MSLAADGPPWFCAHCERELETGPYLDHVRACLEAHIQNWPIHEINWGTVGASGCPELCGLPEAHVEAKYQCPECGNRFRVWGKHRHQEGILWREG